MTSPEKPLRRYAVEVSTRETFTVWVVATSAKEAERQVRDGEYSDEDTTGGERRWGAVKARRIDDV